MRSKVIIEHATFADLNMERNMLGEVDARVVDLVEGGLDIKEEAKDADAIMVEMEEVGREIIDSAEKCKIISIYATGFDNVDVGAATEKGIYVTTVGDYCKEEVQNHTLALILSSVRKLFTYSKAVKSGKWEAKIGKPIRSFIDLKEVGVPIHAIRDLTLGIFGFGRIGRGLCRKAKSIGFNVIVYDSYVSNDQIAKEGAKPVNFSELLEKSDVISIHAPLTEKTRHMFSYDEFKRMKNSAILVNTARGSIVDEKALIKALEEKEIQAAALDVLEDETPPSEDNPLFQLDNVIITPHSAFYSEESQMELRKRATDQVIQALKGEIPDNLVNKEVISKARSR